VAGAVVDGGDVAALVFVERAVELLQQNPGETDDRVERRPQFVGHAGEKRALGPVGGLRLPHGALQQLVLLGQLARALAHFFLHVQVKAMQLAGVLVLLLDGGAQILDHGIERAGQARQLVAGAHGRHPHIQVAGAHLAGCRGELLHGTGDAHGEEKRAEDAQEHEQHGRLDHARGDLGQAPLHLLVAEGVPQRVAVLPPLLHEGVDHLDGLAVLADDMVIDAFFDSANLAQDVRVGDDAARRIVRGDGRLLDLRRVEQDHPVDIDELDLADVLAQHQDVQQQFLELDEAAVEVIIERFDERPGREHGVRVHFFADLVLQNLALDAVKLVGIEREDQGDEQARDQDQLPAQRNGDHGAAPGSGVPPAPRWTRTNRATASRYASPPTRKMLLWSASGTG